MIHWDILEDIINFVLTLNNVNRQGFLLVVSVVYWTLWKHRNDRCFNDYTVKSARSLIFLIKSLLCYWIGNTSGAVKMAVEAWMPIIEDAIPLNQFLPLEMVVYKPPELTPQI